MLYIVRIFEDDNVFEYEYGNMDHALEQYSYEYNADIFEWTKGKMKLVKRKVDGKEKEI